LIEAKLKPFGEEIALRFASGLKGERKAEL